MDSEVSFHSWIVGAQATCLLQRASRAVVMPGSLEDCWGGTPQHAGKMPALLQSKGMEDPLQEAHLQHVPALYLR
jgi:hypothetical protein